MKVHRGSLLGTYIYLTDEQAGWAEAAISNHKKADSDPHNPLARQWREEAERREKQFLESLAKDMRNS